MKILMSRTLIPGNADQTTALFFKERPPHSIWNESGVQSIHPANPCLYASYKYIILHSFPPAKCRSPRLTATSSEPTHLSLQ